MVIKLKNVLVQFNSKSVFMEKSCQMFFSVIVSKLLFRSRSVALKVEGFPGSLLGIETVGRLSPTHFNLLNSL